MIGSGISSINANSFTGWKSIKDIIIPPSVVEISNAAFDECTALEHLTIGINVATIGTNAFRGALNAVQITVLRETPPTITSSTFAGWSASCIIKVPAASVDAYKAAPNWSAFASRIQAI